MGPIVCQSVVSNDSNLEAHVMAIRPHETAQFQLCIMVFVFDGTFLFTEEFRSVMFFVSHMMIVPSCRCLSAGLSHLSLSSSSFCKFVDSFHLRFVQRQLVNREPRRWLFALQNETQRGPKISQLFDAGVAQSLGELRVRYAAMSQDGWVNQGEGKQSA